MRTAEKKREALRAKETAKETPPATPATPSTPHIPSAITATEPIKATPAAENVQEIASTTQGPAAEAVGSAENVVETRRTSNAQETGSSEDQMDIPQQSIEVGSILSLPCLSANC